jgi:hypothetical protein
MPLIIGTAARGAFRAASAWWASGGEAKRIESMSDPNSADFWNRSSFVPSGRSRYTRNSGRRRRPIRALQLIQGTSHGDLLSWFFVLIERPDSMAS